MIPRLVNGRVRVQTQVLEVQLPLCLLYITGSALCLVLKKLHFPAPLADMCGHKRYKQKLLGRVSENLFPFALWLVCFLSFLLYRKEM